MAAFGAFGKMPAVGDFFRIGVPGGFVDPWDGWLQAGMLECQAGYGGDWDGLFMQAPIWRFSLSAGLAGSAPVMGVLMPSVDRVGRRFPLTLMAALDAQAPLLASHFHDDALFVAAEDLALSALDDLPKPALEEGLAALPAPRPRNKAWLRGAGRALVLSQGQGIAGAASDIAAALLAPRFSKPSIWTSDIAGVPRVLVCDGLPQGAEFRALYDLRAQIWTEARPI